VQVAREVLQKAGYEAVAQAGQKGTVS
jgi:hypothetical protein